MKDILENPRIIPCAIYAPGRIISQLVIKGKNAPGVLAKIASKIAEHGINILSGLITAEPGAETGVLVLFLDLTGSKLSTEKLVEELKSLDVVIDAKITAKRFKDITIDGTSYETFFLGKRIVMLDVNDVGTMLSWLDETFGTGGHAILFEMGEAAGKAAAERLRKIYGLEGRDLVETFLALHTAAGWFDYEIVEYDEEALKFVIRLFGNFECVSFADRRKKPMSHLVRGALTGVFSEAYRANLRATEVKCVAEGDTCCEFVIEPPG
mgnify:CR=1 FL=1